MNEPIVTFQGWVGDVVHRDTNRGSVANLRVGNTPRIRKQNGDWVDGPTSWYSVTCWRTLADHVRDSVRKGEPVVVQGRLRADVWQREDGQSSTTYVVDATSIGHDLSRGTTVFVKAARPERVETEEDAEVVKSMIHEGSGDLPQLDSSGQALTEPAVAPSRVA
jgi:single-strand DNA-binding protein